MTEPITLGVAVATALVPSTLVAQCIPNFVASAVEMGFSSASKRALQLLAANDEQNHHLLRIIQTAYVDAMTRMAGSCALFVDDDIELDSSRSLTALTAHKDFSRFRNDAEQIPLDEALSAIDRMFTGGIGRIDGAFGEEDHRRFNRIVADDLCNWGIPLAPRHIRIFEAGIDGHAPWHRRYRIAFGEALIADPKAKTIFTVERLGEIRMNGIHLINSVDTLHDRIDRGFEDSATATASISRDLEKFRSQFTKHADLSGDMLREIILRIESSVLPPELSALKAEIKEIRETLKSADPQHKLEVARAVDDLVEQLDATRSLPTTERQRWQAPRLFVYRREAHAERSAVSADLEDLAVRSECRLRAAASGMLGPLKGIVLIDAQVASTLGRAARDIIAWGHLPLSVFLAFPYALHIARREALEHGWLIITADDLFTTHMTRLCNGSRVDGHAPGMRDMLEPIRPLMLLVESEYQSGTTTNFGDHGATVTTLLELDAPGTRTTIGLNRTYSVDGSSTASRLIEGVDWGFGQASIWPDFRAPNWPFYVARLSNLKEPEQMRPVAALSRSIIVSALEACTTPDAAEQAIRAINRGILPEQLGKRFQRLQTDSGPMLEELQTSDRPFDAIFYFDFHPDNGETPVGCVRPLLQDIQASSKSTSIAVDFGTTSSVASLAGGGGRPVALKGRVVHPITFQEESRNREWQHFARWNYVDFLPLAERWTPTPTVVIRRYGADRNSDFWIARNLIYFHPAGSHAREGLDAEVSNMQRALRRAVFHLKWSANPDEIDASSDFLRQFMIMVAAEAIVQGYDIRRLEWRFSVPDLMPLDRVSALHDQFEKIVREVSPEGKLQAPYSEGLAAARFVLAGANGPNGKHRPTNVILDIGGGTTDVTIWANDKPVWQGSFKLGGRDFFTQTIVSNPDILEAIGLRDWAALITAEREDSSRALAVELLLSLREVIEAFDRHWHDRLAANPGEVLRSVALTYLSGIAFYLGLVGKHLVAKGLLTDADFAQSTFALCGRGATIFRYLHGFKTADTESIVTRALETFGSGLGSPITRPHLFLSGLPKLEVTAGMLIDFPIVEGIVGSYGHFDRAMPSGLQLDLADGTSVSFEAELGKIVVDGRLRGVKLDTVLDFLEEFHRFTGIKVDLGRERSQSAFHHVASHVQQSVEHQRRRDAIGAQSLFEPPFISGLRALIGTMATRQEDRDRLMNVTWS